MSTRTIYATIRIDLKSDAEEITDEMVERFTEDCLYSIPSTGDVEVEDTFWESTRY